MIVIAKPDALGPDLFTCTIYCHDTDTLDTGELRMSRHVLPESGDIKDIPGHLNSTLKKAGQVGLASGLASVVSDQIIQAFRSDLQKEAAVLNQQKTHHEHHAQTRSPHRRYHPRIVRGCDAQ